MSKIWEAFKEVLSEEQLSEEVKKLLFAKLIPTIAEAFDKILSEEPLSVEVKNSLLLKLMTDLVDLEPLTIEVQLNPSNFGLSEEQIRQIREGQSWFEICNPEIRPR